MQTISNPPINWSRLRDIISAHQRFLLTSHVRPDGDAVGCEAAMSAILTALGKDVLVCNPFSLPSNLQFLDPQRKFVRLGKEITAEHLADRQVLIIVDTSAWAQLGAMAEVVKRTLALKVVIDHHVSNDDLGAELFKNEEAEATGRLVVELADYLGVDLTPEIAQAAFVALATDTGWFRFASTTAETLRSATRLVAAGAVPDKLYHQLYENDSLARLQLIGRALTQTRTEREGTIIYSWLRRADFAAVGALPSDSEDIINLLFSVNGTQVGLMFVEQPTGGYKVSLRSRCEVDCSVVAGQFGGGGHRQAAGVLLNEPLEAAVEKILAAVYQAMSRT